MSETDDILTAGIATGEFDILWTLHNPVLTESWNMPDAFVCDRCMCHVVILKRDLITGIPVDGGNGQVLEYRLHGARRALQLRPHTDERCTAAAGGQLEQWPDIDDDQDDDED